jgi:peroxiredoxin
MSTTTKMAAGAEFPKLTVPQAGGGEIRIGGTGNWQMLVVYRGKHCPVCRTYLKTLNELLDDYRAINVDVVAVSGDPKEKAETEIGEESWRFPVGYDLKPDQMRALGLYISTPRSEQETDRPFPEPGLFLVTPDNKAQIIEITNAPWVRPDLRYILRGVKMIHEKNYPIRGTTP